VAAAGLVPTAISSGNSRPWSRAGSMCSFSSTGWTCAVPQKGTTTPAVRRNGDRAGQFGIVALEDVVAAMACSFQEPIHARDALTALGPHPAPVRGKTKGEVGRCRQSIQITRSDPFLVLALGEKHDLTNGEAMCA